MPKVLITGGLGYIGVALARKLASEPEWEVTVLDRNTAGMEWKNVFPASLRVLTKDLFSLQKKEIEETEIVIHLAAFSSPHEKGAELFRTNVEGTRRMCELARAVSASHFLFASSAAVYGEGVEEASEEEKTVPQSAYGLSKLKAEKVLLERSSAVPVILRLGTLYGFSPRMRWDLPVHKMVRDALLFRKISLKASGEILRPFLSLENLLEAFMSILKALPEKPLILNLPAENLKLKKIASWIAELLPCALEYEQGLPSRYSLSYQKYISLFPNRQSTLQSQLPSLISKLKEALLQERQERLSENLDLF